VAVAEKTSGTRTAQERVPSSMGVAPSLGPDVPARKEAPVLPYALGVAALVLTYWCVDIVWPALPGLRDDLALSGTGAGMFSALFFGGRLLANAPAALLVERIGAVRTGASGGVLLAVGSALAATAGGAPMLFAARALQGAGVSLLVTAALLSVVRARPERGAAMTTFNLAAGVGGAGGLISGGVLAEAGGWRWVFWLSVGLAGAVVLAAVRSRHASASPARVTPAPANPEPVAAHAAPGGRFAAATPFVANLVVFVNYSVFVVSLPLYAAERFDASAGRIATLLLALNLIHLGGAWPAGRAIRRWGSDRALVAGYGVTALGLAGVLGAPSLPWLVAPLACYALGQVTGSTAAGDLILRSGASGGSAVGQVRFSSDIGLVAGPAAVGVLADLAGVRATFVVLAAATAVAAIALARPHRPRVTGRGILDPDGIGSPDAR